MKMDTQPNAAPAIYAAMASIMQMIEPVRKDKTNKQGEGFKYRGIDDVMNNLHAAFAINNVFITTEVLERSEVERKSSSGRPLFYVTQKIKFTFHAPDGSSVCSIINGTAMDSGDKADNKSLSIGLKYALLQAFLVPTDDMAEPDAHTHEVAGKPQITPAALEKVCNRIAAGEDLAEKTRATYILNAEQGRTLDIAEQIRIDKQLHNAK